MLRNGNRTAFQRLFLQKQQLRKINAGCMHCSKNSFNANRQGKLMSKLFGQRIAGSKKRWYPTTDATAQSKHGGSLFFKASHISKPGSAGKNTNRRSSVLNKLFMEGISSLLATGAIADVFLGRSLQLTRVKIAPDFAHVNVYWLGTGNAQLDGKLSEDLQHYSGLLRHELSQLRVMGEVPRIHFVQDKTLANIENVESLLRSLDLDKEHSDAEEDKIEFQHGAGERVKQDFYGNKEELNIDSELEQEASLPPMRHDVFGLDHSGIVSKILTKMKKTKQAWDMHSERQLANTSSENMGENAKSVQQQLEEIDSSSSESFRKFLAQRRDRRNTPERKKYRKEDNIGLMDVHYDKSDDIAISKQQRDYLNQEDYIHEDLGSERKT